MGRPTQRKFVARSAPLAAAVTTTSPAPVQITNPFPVGDIVYESLNLRFAGAFTTTTGGGVVVTDGGLQFIRALYFSTPQHSMIVEGLDGIMLHDMQAIEEGHHPTHDDIASVGAGDNPSYEYFLKLAFKDFLSYDIQDTGLDVQRSGQPLLQLNLGINTDFVSGGDTGDAVAATAILSSFLRMDPGRIDPASEAPQNWMPYRGVLKVPISATVSQYQIYLAFGDRIIKRLYVTQRNGSSLARLANTIIGANDSDQISLKVNSNFPWFDRMEWLALQDANCSDYKLSAMPVGVGVIDFWQPVAGGSGDGRKGGQAGAKLADALSVISKDQGTLELDVDVTTVTNGQLWIGYDAVKVLPAGARRPAPEPAK